MKISIKQQDDGWIVIVIGGPQGPRKETWTAGIAADAIHEALNMSGKLGSEAANLERRLRTQLRSKKTRAEVEVA